MSIFGQVWLWSLAAFFVGVLLTWLVLVLPLRKSVRKLESALAQAHADAARTPANAAGLASADNGSPGTEVFARPEPSYPGTLVGRPALARGDVHEDIDQDFAELEEQVPPGHRPESEEYRGAPEPEYAEAGYRGAPDSEFARPAEPEYGGAEEHDAPESSYAPPEQREEPEGDPYRAAATQYLTPATEPEDPYRAAAGDFLQDEPAAAPVTSRLEQRLDPDPGALFRPPAGEPAPAPDWFDHEPLPDRSPFEEPVERTRYLGEHAGNATAEDAEKEPPKFAFADGAAEPELPETPAEATQVLPKRQPRGATRGGFDPPQPIEPSMRMVERRDPELTGAHSGSLFEPSVQPGQPAAGVVAPEPPPARQAAADAVPPGPFGPGSAMPRPGGGRPGDGFAVKASVTALRYCTEESAQFPRMVAEVWFRTPEDAERVGFRPLT